MLCHATDISNQGFQLQAYPSQERPTPDPHVYYMPQHGMSFQSPRAYVPPQPLAPPHVEVPQETPLIVLDSPRHVSTGPIQQRVISTLCPPHSLSPETPPPAPLVLPSKVIPNTDQVFFQYLKYDYKF